MKNSRFRDTFFAYRIDTKIIKASVILFMIVTFHVSYANPVLDNVAAGNVTVTQSTTTTVVNQSSQQAIINWNSFNIAAGEKTQFVQPNASAIALNRINPAQGASQIYGSLSSNGRIILINAAGIHFGPNAMVNVGSLIASTSDISNANFLAGNFNFNIPSTYAGSIINEGTIIAAKNGLVALIGANIQNNGMIQAEMGSIVLGTGNRFTLDFYGDQLINFSVDAPASSGGKITNTGKLLADGGKILVSAQAAAGVLDNTIDMQGVAQARSVYQHNGEIILSSNGDVTVSGKLMAGSKHKKSNSTGGTIKILGANVHLTSSAYLNVSGSAGGGEILIGGNFHGSGPEQNALTTTVDAGAVLNASAITSGNGGKVAVWSDDDTAFHGSIFAEGGMQSGDGGYVETSGDNLDITNGIVNTLSPMGKTGTWLLDPLNVMIGNNSLANDVLSGGLYTPNATGAYIQVNGPSGLNAQLATSNITITTGGTGSIGTDNGDIVVAGTADSGGAANISWSSGNTLTLSAYRNITIDNGAAITNNSGAGSLVLNANNSGAFATVAGANPGGAITNNGAIAITGTGTVTAYYNPLSYANPQAASSFNSITTNVTAYMLVNGLGTATDLDNTIGNNSNLTLGALAFASNNGTAGSNASAIWASSYALSNSFSASATNNDAGCPTCGWTTAGFSPIGNNTTHFSGKFNGQNNTIDSLFINKSSSYTGLFGYSTGLLTNLGLTNASITMSGANNSYLGGLVGFLGGSGSVTNSYVTGAVAATGGNAQYIGGLIGQTMSTGPITSDYNAATVSITSSGSRIGGIIGSASAGAISQSYNTGAVSSANGTYIAGLVAELYGTSSVTNSYNTGAVTAGSGSSYVGGLIAYNNVTTRGSYNTGAVTAPASNYVGGLVGAINNLSNVITSYNSGTVTVTGSGTNIGGLVGYLFGHITSSYNTGTVLASGSGNVGGLVGNEANSLDSVVYSYNSGLVARPTSGYFIGSILGYGFNNYSTDIYDSTISSTSGYSVPSIGSGGTGGTIGATTAQMALLATYTAAGWSTTAGATGSITSTPSTTAIAPNDNWFIFPGQTRPILMAEYNTNITNAHQLQLAGTTLGANYTLANNIDLTSAMHNTADVWETNQTTPTGAGFAPIGTFTGLFNGQNYAINALYINPISTATNYGLFSVIGASGTVENLSVTNAVLSTSTLSAGISGILAGFNQGIIQGISVSGSNANTKTLNNSIMGGLLGENQGTISSSQSSAILSGVDAQYAGGLVGENLGLINTSFASGNLLLTLSNSNIMSMYEGGLIGYNNSQVTNSYATGGISGNNANLTFSIYRAGLVGNNGVNGSIVNTFATGNMSTVNTGLINSYGLVGANTGVVLGSYWDTKTSGLGNQTTSGLTTGSNGGIGMITADMQTLANFNSATSANGNVNPNWDFNTIWNFSPGLYPFIFPPTTRSFSGVAPGVSDVINLYYNGGTPLTTTAVGGIFSFNVSFNSIPVNVPILFYDSTLGDSIVTLAPANYGNVTGINNFTLNTINIGNYNNLGSNSYAFSNSMLSTIIGTHTANYSAAGSLLTLNIGTNFNSTLSTAYNLNGSIAASGTGSINFSNAVTIPTASAVTLSTVAGNISLGNIVNGAGSLTTTTVSGTTTFSGSIGNNVALASLITNGSTAINAAIVNTSGSQTYNNAVILGANAVLSSTGNGIIDFVSTLNGGFSLTTNTGGNTIFGGVVGGATPLSSLTANGNSVIVNNTGGTANTGIATTGNQTYNAPVTVGASLSLVSAANITLNNGVNGAGKNLLLTGTGGNSITTIIGNLAANLIKVTGSNSANNKLSIQTGNSQTWTMTDANSGVVTNTGSNQFTFSNIANLSGSSNNDIFVLNGGTLSGGITGGSGVNDTFVAGNVNNTFNITGLNRGSVTGVAGGFTGIENLTGGSNNNAFSFLGYGNLSGQLNGGGGGMNTLTYASYSTPVNVTMTSQTAGYTLSSGATITHFINISSVFSPNNHPSSYAIPIVKNSPAQSNELQTSAVTSSTLTTQTTKSSFLIATVPYAATTNNMNQMSELFNSVISLVVSNNVNSLNEKQALSGL